MSSKHRMRAGRAAGWGALGAAAVALAAGAGCGDRDPFWSQPVNFHTTAFGLDGAVALVDYPADRVVTLVPDAEQRLSVRAFPAGTQILNVAASPDGRQLLVLAAGHRAKLGDPEPDQPPSLTIVQPSAGVAAPVRRIDLRFLTDPLSGLALDPGGRWAVLYAGSAGADSGAFVENPNELVIVDLADPSGAPVAHTLQSFGGRVVRLTFTPELALPGGPRHLLVVETDQDLSLLQLEHPETPEITVPLTAAGDTRRLAPAGITVDDGDPARDDDARIGIRLEGDPGLVMLQLEASATVNGFRPTVNISDAGGVPSDIAFVRTDGGLRLAALVPSQSQAVLVEPETGAVAAVALPAAYRRLSLVTAAAGGGAAGTDVALLWSGDRTTAGAAFWELGRTSGAPYRSVEPLAVAGAIGAVLDVPPPRQSLKVLAAASGDAFYLLDLATRTTSPLLAPSVGSAGLSLSVSPLGDQVLSFVPSQATAATVDLGSAHPRSLLVDRPVSGLFEVARADGGRSLIALHDQGDVGATVFDAETADSSKRRLYAGLLLEEGTP